jgi:hypothetical protein
MIDGGDRYARLAARVLKEQPEQAESGAPEGRRDRVVAAMALAIEAKRRKRRTLVGAGILLAAAAAALFTVRVTRKHTVGTESSLLVEENLGAGNALLRNAVQKPLLDGARVVEGDSVQADRDGRATLAFANGTRVTLSAAGRVRIDELASTRRFSLQAGRVRAKVAKLGPGERFVVDTPDAEVEVRGTVFDVAVGGGCSDDTSRSTVEVSEGAVWVRSGSAQVVLHPGESWTSPCPEAPAAKVESPTVAPAAATPPRPAHPRHHTVAHPTSAPSPAPVAPPAIAPPSATAPPSLVRHPSHLAEQNNLFSAAMAAEHRGDHATAIGKLDELIRRFPSGPLVESARAERKRIVAVQPMR